MKKLIIAFNFLLLLAVGGRAQDHADRLYSVAFYNLENLFDTIHDTGKNDYEYLPDAAKGWNSEKYRSKLKNLSKVLGELSRDKVPAGPAVPQNVSAQRYISYCRNRCGGGGEPARA